MTFKLVQSPTPQSPYYDGVSNAPPSGTAVAGLVISCITAVVVTGLGISYWNKNGNGFKCVRYDPVTN
jgi:hypothetical protein